ncbi:MAG: glycerol-3-phosphate 1-O-acyltransferase PlsY [Nitrospiria bacterium]
MNIGLVLSNYFIGSLPFGLMLSKLSRGLDPRKKGSGNIGATNVLRVVGKKEAVLTVSCDLLKGIPLIFVASRLGLDEKTILLIAISAVLGHMFSIFLKFKGGKGVATSFGIFLVVSPQIALIGFFVWMAAVLLSRYVSVGALTAFGLLPFLALLFKPEKNFVFFASTIAILIYFRHWENICRLIQGKEGGLQSLRK